MADQILTSFINRLELPTDFDTAFSDYIDPSSGRIALQEGQIIDFKRDFPNSFSSDYFAGVLKHICAFHNADGGFLIFGVHDEYRKGGHNPTPINIDKLNSNIASCL